MKQSHIHQISQPKVKAPILVVGLPGIANIGKTVARLLIEFTRAPRFADLYSPTFQDYVFIDKTGICHPPRYEFYASPSRQDIVILTGDGQPALEDIPAHYEVCGDVLDFAVKLRCSSIVAVDGTPSAEPTRDTYVAGNSTKHVNQYLKNGALAYRGGRIIGAPGLLLGLGELRRLKGGCLLGSTSGLTADREAAFRIYKILKKVIGTEVQEAL